METNLSGGYETNKNSGNPIRYADLSALDGSVTRQSDNFIYPQNQGFLIKLGSPASLMFQKENCPITSKIKFVDMSSALQVNVSSNVDVFRDCAELVATVVRYALANQELVDTSVELSTLINAAPSASFAAFEMLCEKLLRGITEQVNVTTEAFVLTVRDGLFKIGGESLRGQFDEKYSLIKDEMDFHLGLVRDREFNSFGPSSDEFKIRLFKDNYLFVLAADYAVSNINLATLVYRINHQINNPFTINNLDWLDTSIDTYWIEEQTIELGKQVSLTVIEAALEQLIEHNQYQDECSTVAELKKAIERDKGLKPYLYALVENDTAWRSLWQQVAALDEEKECPFTTLVDGLGLAFIDKLKTELHASLKNNYVSVGEHIDDVVTTTDDTYLSLWVKEAKEILDEQRQYSDFYNFVFDSTDESDEMLGGTSVVQLFDSRYADVDSYYENHHNYLMEGEVSTLSTCMKLNKDTLKALEGWQKAIVLEAAFCACSKSRGVKCE